MSARSSTSVSSRAYLKLLLHAAKYQSRSVIGLLVGQADGAAAASSSRGAVRVTDVLPLFHTAPLAPMIELALGQAETLVRTGGYPAGSTIVGLYFSPEHYDLRGQSGADGSLALPMPQASVVVKMAEKIAANGSGVTGSRILMLDNVRLGALGAPNSEASHSALECFESRAGGKWGSAGAALVENGSAASSTGAEDALDGAVATLRVLLQNEQQRALCDFDDHLDDAKADWSNKQLDAQVLPTN